MIHWTIESSLLSGAELEYPSSIATNVRNLPIVLIISTNPNKFFSLVVKVVKHTTNNSLKNPVIKLDKENLGPLVGGDEVILVEYNPPIAKQVLLSIDRKYSVVEGNWGNNIVNPAVIKHIIDLGQKIDFMYGSKTPFLVSGQVKATVPKAPALVDASTIFIVEKLSSEQLMKLKIESDRCNEKRAQEYLKNIKDEKFTYLSSIRNNSIDKLEKTFHFSQVDPETVYKLLINLLETSFHSFLLNNYDAIRENHLVSILAYPKPDKDPTYLVEIILTAKNNEGVCSIIGYSPQLHIVENVIIMLEKQVTKASIPLREVPKVLSDFCGGCNARLDLTKQNEKGIVFCSACKSPNVLPFSLRI